MTPKQNQTKYLILLTAGLLLTASTGYVYGHLSQRWGPSADLTASASHLQTMPQQIGDWQMLEELGMEDEVAAMLESAGDVTRRYVNQITGGHITVFVVIGPPGPIAVHTPEICYSSREYEIQDKHTKATFSSTGAESHTLWHSNFRSKRMAKSILSVYYAWSTGDTWLASESPRYQYGGEPLLYKLQIAGFLDTTGTDPSQQFLEALFQTGWTLSGP
ncbi:MAG: exosortase-associated EpsI family protein [Pirellulales bacterium]